MTIKEAFCAAIAPYVLPKITVEFLLTGQELDPDDDYEKEYEVSLYKCVIDGLTQLRTLVKEKDPGTENAYDVEQIDKMIEYYGKKIDPDYEDYEFIDRTDEW